MVRTAASMTGVKNGRNSLTKWTSRMKNTPKKNIRKKSLRSLGFSLSVMESVTLSFLRGGFGPFAVGADQVHQALVRHFHGDAFLHAFFADVEVDLSRASADIAEVRVRHLSGAVHDA